MLNATDSARHTLLDELSVRHIIWNITASTDLYLYIVICPCLCELHIVSVYIYGISVTLSSV